MDIAKRDLEIERIKKEINNRNTFLKSNFKELKSSKNENILLKDIYTDYNSYYNNQLTEKKALLIILQNLFDYIETARQSAEISKHDAKRAKHSAKETLKLLNKTQEQVQELYNLLEIL